MSLRPLSRTVLPALTSLIGSGGFIIGLWSFISPASAATAFGGYMVRVLEATASSKADSGMIYIYPHGIRNLVQGLSILALTAYWQFSRRCQSSPVARVTVQRCLGIVITANALTPMVDAWVNLRAAQNREEGDLDRNAARLHATRLVFWAVGGLWCLLG
ncbi:uncharacterized protein A1O5_10561 [Cladophialophora psammophila CBS 110553]|uniref:Uncharacterized protein n=1 Tax=Cladophialophora psammophila CBS 110553 TaxID=1182543 RepID=W9X7J0_9EURO|nr:uncharacterized protein A1O5_10561 [Cladophialophora psammophila CBS 110553]EXJ66409.1 hypothetical protein A1O5_10561 [Cladophialophora psammophila CBS 110553]